MKFRFFLALLFSFSVFSAASQMPDLLKPGGTVALLVEGADEVEPITMTYAISEKGTVKLPLLEKEIAAAGITANALILRINDSNRANGLPRIVVSKPDMGCLLPPVITISGGVLKPGEYPLRQGLTVLAAIHRAGGFSNENRKVKILRNQKEFIYDVRKIHSDGSNNPVLMDGDVIIVPESSVKTDLP